MDVGRWVGMSLSFYISFNGKSTLGIVTPERIAQEKMAFIHKFESIRSKRSHYRGTSLSLKAESLS